MRNPFESGHSRLPRLRGILVAFLVIVGMSFNVSQAMAAAERAYAGIVVDAKSGKTLYESAADAARYPASVTKVMTLYVLFEELKAGRMSLSTKMTVSKHAAAAVPTKLGLAAGKTIKVEDAIKALVTLSANDIARVIAESISGSESAFAQRMTKTARALGMSRTTYKNASGLPDSGQVTTARDQARLGIAIYEHFPDYYKYFQTRSFKYGGKTYGNHNRLLGAVPGVDGIKTGYIRASGYNLLTAARKDNRHIVVVGFGFDTGASRNAKVEALVRKYLPKARSGTYLATAQIPVPGSGGSSGSTVIVANAQPAPLPAFRRFDQSAPIPSAPIVLASAPMPEALAPPVAVAAAPMPEPLSPPTGIAAATMVAEAAPASVPRPEATRPLEVIGAWISTTLRLDANSGAPVPPAAIDGPMPPMAVGIAGSNGAIDLLTSGSIGNAAAETTDEGEFGWVVQIGAAPSQSGAETLLASAAESGKLGDYRRYVERFERNGQVFFRARIAGFSGRDQARAACESLKQINMNCLAMQG